MYHYITIPEQEIFDEKTSTFVSTKEVTLRLIHSLVSVHKWEMLWKKSFLKTFDKDNTQNVTKEEILSYVECMTLTPNINPEIYLLLTPSDIEGIFKYIEKRTITAELIYSWMILQGIPKEYEKWHLNTLMTLIRIVSIEGNPKRKKETKAQALARHRATNAKRRGKR